MTAMSLRLSESLHQAAKELAAREGISVNQLVATALAEKVASLMTAEYLERAKRGDRGKFLAAMARVPDVSPDTWDELPDAPAPKTRKRPAKASRKSASRRKRKAKARPRG